MGEWIIFAVSVGWIAAGLWSSFLAMKLYALSNQDRGALWTLPVQDPSLHVVANKMVRLSMNRLSISMFGVFAGVVLLLEELYESGDPDGTIGFGALLLVVGFLLMIIGQGVITMLDIEDREKLLNVPSTE